MEDRNGAREQAKAGYAIAPSTSVSLAPTSSGSSDILRPLHKLSKSATSERNRESPTTSPSVDAFERPPTSTAVLDLPPSTSVSPASSKYNFGLRHWKWELAACVLVLAIAAAMVATMYPHGNQPIPQWPFKITINPIPSIYSLVFKAAIGFVVTSSVGQLQCTWFSSSQSRLLSDVILYNDAGHSLWGSIVLLWTQRMRQPLIIMAVFIMLANVIFDPFIQQFIQPFDCSIPLNDENATLPRTNVIGEYFGSGVSGRVPPEFFWSALSASASGPSGIEMPWTCSTGNCTFPDNYDIMDICNACEDKSDKIEINTTTLSENLGDFGSKCSGQQITSYIPSGDVYYWSANGDRLSTTFFNGCDMSQHTDIAQMDIWVPNCPDIFGLRVDTLVSKTTFSDARRLISTGESITGCDSPGSHRPWACRGYGAAACTLKPCIRTYSASIESGRLTERLVSQSPDIKWGRHGRTYGILDNQCLSAEGKAFLTAHDYEIDDPSRWTPFEGDLSNVNSGSQYSYSNKWLNGLRSLLDHRWVYLMDEGLVNKIGQGTWPGTFIRNPAASNIVGTVRGLQKTFSQFDDQTVIDTFGGPQLLQVIYNYGNVDLMCIDDVFTNISEALTTFIRTNGNETYSAPVVGQAQHYAIRLGVQWPWIIMPAILAASTIIFLFLVMESTRRLRMPIWKASLLTWVLGDALEGNNIDSAILVDEPSGSVSRAQGLHTYATMPVLQERSRSIVVSISRKPERNIAMYDLQYRSLHSP